MLSTDFWDNWDNMRSLFPFTALTTGVFAGFARFLADLSTVSVDKMAVARIFATVKSYRREPCHTQRE